MLRITSDIYMNLHISRRRQAFPCRFGKIILIYIEHMQVLKGREPDVLKVGVPVLHVSVRTSMETARISMRVNKVSRS